MWKMGLVAALLLASPAVAGEHGMPIGSGTVTGHAPAEVLKTLAAGCVRKGAGVEQLTDSSLVCAQAVSGMKGALTQALLGNSYSTAPIMHYRFTAVAVGPDTLLQISQSVDMISAFGKPMNNVISIKQSDVDKIIAGLSSTPSTAGAATAPGGPVPIAGPVSGPKFGFGLAAVPEGLYVRSIDAGSPAATAKMVPGMVITHMNGVPLAGMDPASAAKMMGAFRGEATFTIVGVGDVKVRKPDG